MQRRREPVPAARRTAEQTRELLVDTALGMLHERGPTAGVSHIKLSDVVARAGLTTGAAYRLWDDQGAFHAELAVKAVRWRNKGSTEAIARQVLPAVAAGLPWQEVVRRGAQVNLDDFPDDVAFLTTLALRASGYNQPALRAAGAERHRDALAAYGVLHAQVMKAYRRRFKPPYTLEHLSSVLAALSEGFGLQAACGDAPEHVQLTGAPAGTGSDWTLLGVAAVALVEHMTEPEDAG